MYYCYSLCFRGRDSLMKSLIVHLEEREDPPSGLTMTKIPTGPERRARPLKQRSSMEHLED